MKNLFTNWRWTILLAVLVVVVLLLASYGPYAVAEVGANTGVQSNIATVPTVPDLAPYRVNILALGLGQAESRSVSDILDYVISAAAMPTGRSVGNNRLWTRTSGGMPA